jgi:uncharacterized membrane protein
MKRILAVLIGCLIAAYPFIVFYGLQSFPLSYVGMLLITIALLRLWVVRDSIGKSPLPLALTLVLILVAAYTLLSGSPQGLRFYPVAVNGTFLLVFASSLWVGMPVVERLARLHDPDLPPAAVEYTRKVTVVWCVFFVFNGLIALYTAGYSSFEHWAIYNGGIAYGLISLLFCAEWLVRRRVRRAIDASV